jgi:peptidoglycan-associated lipoprotein
MNSNRIGLGWLALAGCLGCAHPQAMTRVEETAMAVPSTPVAVAKPRACPAPAACSIAAHQVVEQSSLHFAFDKDVLTPLSERYLRDLARTLKACPAAKVQIEGNADERGTEEYNLALGQRRAEVAKHYQLETISYGEEKPVDPAHDEQAWAMNRRDDFKLEAGGSAAAASR